MAKIDYDALFGGAEYDPCAALQALRPALMKLRVQGQVQEVKFRDRDLKFGRNDVNDLQALVAQLESECAAKNGLRGPRRGIRAAYPQRTY